MSFGRRITLPFITVILLAQVAVGAAFYTANRVALLDDAKMQVVDTIDQAVRQLGATRSLTTVLPHGAGLVVADSTLGWTVVDGDLSQAMTMFLPRPGEIVPPGPEVVDAGDETVLLQISLLPAIPGQSPAAIVAVRSLSDSLRHYHVVWLVLAGGLVVSLTGALLAGNAIDRSLMCPVKELAARIARIGEGDYSPPSAQPRGPLGQRLSVALTTMARAIANREQQIRAMVLHEPVTRLPNRAAFLAEIAPKLGAESGAVLVIGLVHAQELANTVNRDATDRVLRHAAARLGRLLGDVPLACLSDRSFAVFLQDVGKLRARTIAVSIVAQLEVPYGANTSATDTAAAVGIALMPTHGDEAALLLRRAEVALQTSMHAEHRWAVYDHAADPHRPDRLSMMSDLRQGLGRGEFVLVYQPRLHVASGRVTGVEALIRWHHPRRGLVPTDEFIGLAEETGNIGHLTRWALRAGIEQAARWKAQGIDLQVSINVSARDLGDERLANRVMQLLSDHQLAPEAISLEVTESTLMINPTVAIAVLRRLAEHHIAVSVDDFGVGRASLAYLRTLPVRELKIDRAFVQRLAEGPDDRTIVRSVVELGHSLGLAVSVEGVEDAATLAAVSELGCDYVQGYFIARPLEPEMLLRFVQRPPPCVLA